MKKATICFCVKDDQVLLGMKKYDFGEGKWNGFGGKVKEGETSVQAAVRELEEESCLVSEAEDMEKVAVVKFSFEGVPKFECDVFLTSKWQGEPTETKEMRPQWFPIKDVPYDEMWVADAKWIPLILRREKIEAEVDFNEEGTAVESFNYKSVVFN